MSALARPFEEIAGDVRRVVRAGIALADARDEALVSSLVASTRLSREGVLHAFDVALERDVTDEELRRLVALVRPAEAVTVVLAANVLTAVVRAVALALAASSRVYVRPSRRDPTFARALIATLADPRVTLVADLATRPGVVHAYGRDSTMHALVATTRMPVWAHGAGLSVAVVGLDTSVSYAARAVADDGIVFDQRGCLSPRVAFVVGNAARAQAFGEALMDELVQAARCVPPGDLDADERAAIASARDVVLMCGEVVGSAGAMVAVMEASTVSVPLFPPGRHVVVVPATDFADVRRKLASFGRALVGVASDDVRLARSVAPAWARLALLGRLQRPRLDGPVDLRDVWLLPNEE